MSRNGTSYAVPGMRQVRDNLLMTQQELSKETGVAVNHISRLENSATRCRVGTLKKLLGALGCTVADLTTPPPTPRAEKLSPGGGDEL